MTTTNTSFPQFGDGDLLVVLSGKPEDTLRLHVSTLCKDSHFFKGSLSRPNWTKNEVFVSESGEEFKLLDLDFDGTDVLPLLVGRGTRTPTERLQQRIKSHHEAIPEKNEILSSTFGRQSSNTTIQAYKTLFALMYDIPVDYTPEDELRMVKLLPVVVALADAFSLLPESTSKITHLLFGGGSNGFDIFAKNPFGMLTAACKLRSKVMYQEAMRHAVGLYCLLSELDEEEEDGDHNVAVALMKDEVPDLQLAFDSHVKVLKKNIKTVSKKLLACEPLQSWYTNDSGSARAIASAAWRDWVVKAISAAQDDGHAGLLKLLNRDFDVAGVRDCWAPSGWLSQLAHRTRREDLSPGEYEVLGHEVVTIFGRIYRRALDYVDEYFSKTSLAKGCSGLGTIGKFDVSAGYIASIHFESEYKYPWQDAKPLPSFSPFHGS